MKSILYSIGVGMLAFALNAQAANVDTNTNVKKARAKNTSVQSSGSAKVHANRSVDNTRARHHANATSRARNNDNAVVRHHANVNRERNVATSKHVRRADNDSNVARRNRAAVHRERTVAKRDRTVVNRERNVTVNNNRTVVNRNRNVAVVNNWRGARFNGASYAAFRNYHRDWHHRDWWQSHYSTIVFVSGGWYYWNSGFWYPAWGYDPYYSYVYDGPIYGYNHWTPDRVIVDVQAQLQRDGYYAGEVDGVLGAQTRRAIALFQADHGLAVTAAIDEPTLDTLGLS